MVPLHLFSMVIRGDFVVATSARCILVRRISKILSEVTTKRFGRFLSISVRENYARIIAPFKGEKGKKKSGSAVDYLASLQIVNNVTT